MIEVTGKPKRARHQRVRGLVQQHREVEHDREGEPGDVLPGRRARAAPARPAAPRRPRSARRRGTTSEETSTSLPAIVPTLKVPGGRGGRARVAVAGRSERCRTRRRGYPTRAPRRRRPLSARSPRVRAMSVRAASAVAGRAGLDPGRRGRGARRALAEPGRRLHDLPAALPLPHHRPAARAALPRRRARHGRAQGARGPLRPAGRRAHPRARPREMLRAGLGAAARRPSPSSPSMFADGEARPGARRLAGLVPRRARALLHPRGPDAGSSRPSASCTSRRCSTPGCCCAASSTGSTSRPTAAIRVVDYKTGRAPGERLRGQGAVPDEVLRAGALATARRGARRCCSWSTSATARCCATSPTRPTCSPPSARSRRSGRRSGAAEETGDWRPSPGRLCDWCAHQALCPAFGGTPPPLPERDVDTERRRRTPVGRRRGGRLRSERRSPARPLRRRRRSRSRGGRYGRSAARSRPDQRVAEDPPLPRSDRHVVRDHQHRAAGGLGRPGAGVGVLDGQAVAPGRRRAGGRREVRLGVRLAERRPRRR